MTSLTSLHTAEQAIRAEADTILQERGLYQLLTEYGRPDVQGSYALQLMVWRDLDIYLVTPNETPVDGFFALGGRVANLLSPLRMSFRNERIGQTKGLPDGLYWGIYLGDERRGAWKIDIWAVGEQEYLRLSEREAAIKAKLTTANRDTILAIKSACWQDRQYRQAYSSLDIYEAVLDHRISDLEAFK